MKFAVVVYGAPYSGSASLSALNYAEALLAEGHGLYRVFFYMDGVYNANALAAPPQDEADLTQRWSRFAEANGQELNICIASSLRRGLLDAAEAARHEKPASNLAPGFVITGLGQLIDALICADRVMAFGG